MIVIACTYKTNVVGPKELSIQANHSKLEILFTFYPFIMIILMTFPSFTVLYEQDKIHKPFIKLVGVGAQ